MTRKMIFLQAARQVQEEVARQHAQAIAPNTMQTVPQTQPAHPQQQGHPQHMMPVMTNANATNVVPFRGATPQMSPTPRAPPPPAPQVPAPQIRHSGLPGMDQMPRYTGIPPTRPVGGTMPNQQQQQPTMAMLSNQLPPQQPQQPQQPQSQQQGGK